MTPESYIKAVEERFFACKRQHLSRMDLQWGEFSGKINREYAELVTTLDKNSELANRFKNAFLYWLTLSRLLELNHSRRPIDLVRMKSVKRQADQLRRVALYGGKEVRP